MSRSSRIKMDMCPDRRDLKWVCRDRRDLKWACCTVENQNGYVTTVNN